MVSFGLLGKSLQHSFSKSYFEKKFRDEKLADYRYLNFEIAEIEEFPALLASQPDLRGLNVTVPYKEKVITFLHELNTEAKEIGAVNCIVVHQSRLLGFNTDAYGFAQSIKPFLDTNHERALILGTGGASKAVAYALKKVGVEVYFVSSSNEKKSPNTFFYPEINEQVMRAFKLVVNTTPLGTSPAIHEFPPLPYHLFTSDHLAYDLIYNPAETAFLSKAKEAGAVTMNGLSMLRLQAEKSWEIWKSYFS